MTIYSEAAQMPRPTEPARNVLMHTGTVVHRGQWVKARHAERGWLEAPACRKPTWNSIVYGHPTDRPVTCKRCQ